MSERNYWNNLNFKKLKKQLDWCSATPAAVTFNLNKPFRNESTSIVYWEFQIAILWYTKYLHFVRTIYLF